jgi:hypothetical protein
MPSINLSQLRNTRQLKAWLAAGFTVELREKNRKIGEIKPEPVSAAERTKNWPDFEARLKRNFGDRIIPAVADLIEDREDRF